MLWSMWEPNSGCSWTLLPAQGCAGAYRAGCARTQSLGCKENDCAYFLFVQHHPGSGGLGFLDHVESRSQIQGVLMLRVTEEAGSETAMVVLGLGDKA